MLVLHANWTEDGLHLWAESSEQATRYLDKENHSTGDADRPEHHPFTSDPEQLQQRLVQSGLLEQSWNIAKANVGLFLPHVIDDAGNSIPMPSARLESLITSDLGLDTDLHLGRTTVTAIKLDPCNSLEVLLKLQNGSPDSDMMLGHGLRFWMLLGRTIVELLDDQRVVPSMIKSGSGSIDALWQPWIEDSDASEKLKLLIQAMPPIARCVDDINGGDPCRIVESMLVRLTDARVRLTLVHEDYMEAIEDWDAEEDPHVAWLSGLLGNERSIHTSQANEVGLLRSARLWLSQLDDVAEHRSVRLCFKLNEPDIEDEDSVSMEESWILSLHLVTNDDPPHIIDAEEIWDHKSSGKNPLIDRLGGRGGQASDLLLAELGRATRIWPRLESMLNEATPCNIDLNTKDAYAFLCEYQAVLGEAGFETMLPHWWGQSSSRLGARLLIDSEEMDPATIGENNINTGGLSRLVEYSWQIALGENPMTLEEFQKLAESGSPLVKVNGQWVEIRSEDLEGARRFLKEHPGGQMTALEALRLAHGIVDEEGSLPVLGMDCTGWIKELFKDSSSSESFPMLVQPENFQGSLRPYQVRGLSWLAFLDKFNLGACLADDMGLGKTIQLIALLQHERAINGERPGPTLLIAPMSVVGNWRKELNRFGPELKVHVHHGIQRPMGEEFIAIAEESDIVITTYALCTRDCELLKQIPWDRVTLDEAQHIKNPPTKQTAAIRSIESRSRIALTGTPVENRLTELWSIMEFCTPGYLGGATDFRRRFAIPIERHRDQGQANRLRRLVQPFILRRLKTDPKVITDLPPLVEMRQHVHLTDEQTKLYEGVVEDMLNKVDRAEGIKRRGLVLSGLVKLKQICNHPAHYLKEAEEHGGAGTSHESGMAMVNRSGKSMRLMEMLEELIAADDRALLFTQYRQMGHILVAMIRQVLDREALFLHGGTPQNKREQLIDRFQSDDCTAPIFVLSLKAGGVGLNLTAANHVFHYDRWWNPAVENQATDRAFRIGQKRTVNVHKMISTGTLEERIDEMIEQKTELASRIVGSGENWLTEMSTGQLRELLSFQLSGNEVGT